MHILFGPFFVLAIAFIAGLNARDNEPLSAIVDLAIAASAAGYIHYRMSRSQTKLVPGEFPYSWECDECGRFKLEARREDVLEKAKDTHISRHILER